MKFIDVYMAILIPEMKIVRFVLISVQHVLKLILIVHLAKDKIESNLIIIIHASVLIDISIMEI